jgi:hypothetical protein
MKRALRLEASDRDRAKKRADRFGTVTVDLNAQLAGALVI